MPAKVTPKGPNDVTAIAIYECNYWVPALIGEDGERLRRILNEALGYKNGVVNKVDPTTGDYESLREDPGMELAHNKLSRGLPLTVYVYVFKDGSKLIAFEKPTRAWRRTTRGLWVRRGQKVPR